jgi:aryl-alcohol dehydrogenase-like predicted oxidoreductase
MSKRVPHFENRDDETAFWQRTKLEDLGTDQLEQTELERPPRPLSATFAVRFDRETIERLRAIARRQGIGPTQLVRQWVLERLHIERAAGALASRPGEYQELESILRQRVLDALMERIPEAVEEAMQEVLDRADQERQAL